MRTELIWLFVKAWRMAENDYLATDNDSNKKFVKKL